MSERIVAVTKTMRRAGRNSLVDDHFCRAVALGRLDFRHTRDPELAPSGLKQQGPPRGAENQASHRASRVDNGAARGKWCRARLTPYSTDVDLVR